MIHSFFKAAIIFILSISITYADGYCSGFFITDKGHIATAGHCYANHLSVTYVKDGKVYTKTATVIGVNRKADAMVIKIDDVGMKYFKFSLFIRENEDIGTIGYPDASKFGAYKHVYYGQLVATYTEQFVMNLFSAPGSSGSPVFDSNGDVIGIMVAGMDMLNQGWALRTYATKSTVILQITSSKGIAVSYSNLLPDSISTKEQQTRLFEENKDKVVFI